MPETNDQMIDPEIGNEELEQFLNSLTDGQQIDLPSLGTTPAGEFIKGQQQGDDDEPNSDEPNADGDDDETPAGTPTPTEGVDGVDYFTINGQQFPRADIERLYNFDQFMRQNPDAAQRVAKAIEPATTGTPAVPAAPAPTTSEVEEFKPPEPPEFLDLDDPVAKFQWDSTVSLQKQQFELTQAQNKFFAQQAQERQAAINRQAAVDMDIALKQFRDQYPGLNDDDIATIRTEAGPFVPAMMQQLPPVDALRRSMEVAAFANTDLRKRLDAETPPPTNQHRSATRKQKLSSISGTPRSAPKVDTKPSFQNDRDMVNAFATALNDQMTGR